MVPTTVEAPSHVFPDAGADPGAAVDAVVAIDRRGRVTYWGPGAAALYRLPAEQALGRPLEELFTGRLTTFLALLSHELRNTLAPIRNALLLLERAAGARAAGRVLGILRRQTDQLCRLVEDLLDVSRIAHGKIDVRLARLDAREVIRRAHLDERPLFEQRAIELVLSDAPEPLWVDADAARLSQMIGNLLQNALEFTPPGGRVQVWGARRGACCEIGVRDTGAGIEPAQLERIFDPFVQADRSRSGHGGLGLGLALVKELAAKQGGEVRAESEGPGTGAAFVIELPLVPEAGREVREGATFEDGAGLDVLIVEDNEDAADTLADLLRLHGNRVHTASAGQAGIRTFRTSRPDVVICDIGLPDLSGHDVIRAIRADERGARAFAVALTGYAQPRDRDAALAAGFDAHLSKPPSLDALRSLLREAARRRGAAPAAAPEP